MGFSKGLEKTVAETFVGNAPVAQRFVGLATHGHVLSLCVSLLSSLGGNHDGDQKAAFLRKLHC